MQGEGGAVAGAVLAVAGGDAPTPSRGSTPATPGHPSTPPARQAETPAMNQRRDPLASRRLPGVAGGGRGIGITTCIAETIGIHWHPSFHFCLLFWVVLSVACGEFVQGERTRSGMHAQVAELRNFWTCKKKLHMYVMYVFACVLPVPHPYGIACTAAKTTEGPVTSTSGKPLAAAAATAAQHHAAAMGNTAGGGPSTSLHGAAAAAAATSGLGPGSASAIGRGGLAPSAAGQRAAASTASMSRPADAGPGPGPGSASSASTTAATAAAGTGGQSAGAGAPAPPVSAAVAALAALPERLTPESATAIWSDGNTLPALLGILRSLAAEPAAGSAAGQLSAAAARQLGLASQLLQVRWSVL